MEEWKYENLISGSNKRQNGMSSWGVCFKLPWTCDAIVYKNFQLAGEVIGDKTVCSLACRQA